MTVDGHPKRLMREATAHSARDGPSLVAAGSGDGLSPELAVAKGLSMVEIRLRRNQHLIGASNVNTRTPLVRREVVDKALASPAPTASKALQISLRP